MPTLVKPGRLCAVIMQNLLSCTCFYYCSCSSSFTVISFAEAHVEVQIVCLTAPSSSCVFSTLKIGLFILCVPSLCSLSYVVSDFTFFSFQP